MRTEVLIRAHPAGTPVTEVTFRWLQIFERRVARESADGLEFVDAPASPGEGHPAAEDAVQREVALRVPLENGARRSARIDIRRGSASGSVEGRGRPPGGLVRSWRRLTGSVDAAVHEVRPYVFRLRVEVRNETTWSGDDREDALHSSFNASHLILHAHSAEFVSLTDPPEALEDDAAACDHVGCLPLPFGQPGRVDAMLVAPHPDDLFDDDSIDSRRDRNVLGPPSADVSSIG